MMNSTRTESQEPSIDTDKLSYEIFSILESKFLFGYDDQKLWVPKQVSPSPTPVSDSKPDPAQLVGVQPQSENGVAAIKNQRGKVCILSIDGGGGMRGILSGKALAYLEQALKKKSGNPDARIADYFDVATGAGVGGIFAAMLFATRDHARPIFKADDTWRFLSDHGKSLFNNNRSSTSASSPGLLRRLIRGSGSGSGSTGSATAGLEKVMKEAFVDDDRTLTLKDTLKPVLIPCYDLSSTAPFLFSRADALETDSYDFRLWEVCRATSAEPGVFEPVQMQSVNNQTKCLAVDGGLAMSNPTAAAITHVLHNKQEFPFVRGVEDIMVLSIGSGQFLEEARYAYEQVKKWRAKEWARPMARIAGDGSSDLVDQSVAMAFGQSGSSNYVRIQANGTSLGRCGPNVDTDPSPNNVKKLVGVAEEMLKQKNVESVLFGGKRIGEQSNFEKLDWFAGELVLEHQRRSCRIAPTVAFKQAAPKTS
ncbi:patatin-like protein 6 [Pyrus ussuriensis x Pyrus communis]|uniref:Patatin n=1 Tax=Pyrus ussuriensis x Pyrus communis TaxID=2448454 RepID=A0A5N5FA13_9ROSA|nr:patatin-like protein 6 [Pyrus x bretschneideri]KAB2598072.1 patatin-like protein 6 [Pyrus ussuriensis x Pyrus communis]